MAFTNEKDTGGFVDKLVNIGRVAKVVKGGRRFAFSAIVVVGDESGRVGWGSGKAREVPEAVRKATDVAKKQMVRVPLREGRTIHHNARGEFGGAQVFMKPATPGTGIIAGGPMRAVFESMGMKDVVAKSLGSSNPYNLIQATFEAFSSMETPRAVAAKRGLKMNELRERRELTGFDFSQEDSMPQPAKAEQKAQAQNSGEKASGEKTSGDKRAADKQNTKGSAKKDASEKKPAETKSPAKNQNDKASSAGPSDTKEAKKPVTKKAETKKADTKKTDTPKASGKADTATKTASSKTKSSEEKK